MLFCRISAEEILVDLVLKSLLYVSVGYPNSEVTVSDIKIPVCTGKSSVMANGIMTEHLSFSSLLCLTKALGNFSWGWEVGEQVSVSVPPLMEWSPPS